MANDQNALPTTSCPGCGAAARSNAKFCTGCGAALNGPASALRPQPAAKRAGRWPVLALAGAILLLAAASAALLNKPQTASAPLTGAAVPAVTTAASAPYPDVARMSAEQAHTSVAQGQAVLIDVREAEYFQAGHAAEAISLPESDLPARLAELQLPTDKTIITYCT